MTDKAYIVANKQQELDVLKKFEQKGLVWVTGKYPTTFFPSANFIINGMQFPYALIEGEDVSWLFMTQLTDEEIVYDGRKAENMYKVTQEFMNALIKWRDNNNLDFTSGYNNMFIAGYEIQEFPDIIDVWRTDADSSTENNNRLISILKWLNGEYVFEVEKPHKFVVRSDKSDRDGDYMYVQVIDGLSDSSYLTSDFTKFNTREEAQEWANSHQVVVEIDEDGNEVE